jgi:hypothetical protein
MAKDDTDMGTIDLVEKITETATQVKVTAIYKISGRREVSYHALNKDGVIPNKVQKKIADLKRYPKVQKVLVEKI